MGKILNHKITSGIYVLGTRYKQEINTMIASWVTQVSGDPEMAAVAVKPERYSHGMIRGSRVFTLAVLKAEQADIYERFKGEKHIDIDNGTINGIAYHLGENGAPVPAECVGFLELDLVQEIPAGNHTLFLGRVTRDVEVDGGEPLTAALLLDHFYAGK